MQVTCQLTLPEAKAFEALYKQLGGKGELFNLAAAMLVGASSVAVISQQSRPANYKALPESPGERMAMLAVEIPDSLAANIEKAAQLASLTVEQWCRCAIVEGTQEMHPGGRFAFASSYLKQQQTIRN